MSVFHRLTVPSYFGGLPSGYDYINNAISGTPANADVQKASGPNIGTYFIAFGEDATSSDANRPNLALSTNTDYLDNQMRSDLVDIVRTADSTVGGSPQTSVTLTGTGTIWLGSGGYTFQDLFHIVDSNERDIEVSGTKVVVSGISAGGTLGTGFATSNVTLTLNVGIPVGVTFRMYFCQRTNLATLPIDAMTLPFMRNQASVDGSVVDFVAQISNPHTLGNAVAGVQAYRFQGPDGIRLAKNATMFFDCDPADSGATVRQFEWTTRQATVDRLVAALYDDPTASLFAGLTGMLQVDAGVGYSSLGTLTFQDVNLSSAGSSLHKTWGLTSSTGAHGDQFPRIFDVPITFNMQGAQIPSLLNFVNGRWETTCGDGTVSFGDFSGPQSIHAAIVYAASAGVTVNQLNIRLKRGTYSFTASCNVSIDVVIEGVSPEQTILQGNIGGIPQNALFNLTNGRLWLKGVSMQFVSGQQWAVVGSSGTSLFMDNVEVVDLGIEMVNPATYNNISAVQCRSCRFAPATAGVVQWLLLFDDSNAVPHNGFYFEDCSWFCADETSPMRILGSGAGSACFVQRVSFVRNNYTLGGTATTSSHLTHNTGVLNIDPGGGNALLWLFDVEWISCFVTSSTLLANAPVARIYSVALGDNTGTNRAVVGRVTIRGGRWNCNQLAATHISPVFIAAQEVVVDDVVFLSNAFTTGGPSSEDTNILDGISHSTADWAQFIFAPAAQTVSVLSLDRRLNMTKTSFRSFQQLSNSGDLWLILTKSSVVDGVTLCDYSATGTGTAPNVRVRIQSGVAPSWGTGGTVKDLKIIGASCFSAQWTSGTAGSSGIAMLMPTAANVSDEFEPVTVERLTISSFIAPTQDDGIVLSNLTTYGSAVGWQYVLRDCTSLGQLHNIIMYGSGTAGSGDNGAALIGLNIIGGEYNDATQSGMVLAPDFIGDVLIDGARAKYCTNLGLSVNPKFWNNAGENISLIVVNCKFWNNTSASGQCKFSSNNVGDLPWIIFHSNSCLLNGAVDSASFQWHSNAVLPATATPGSGFFIYGAHTGVAGGGVVVDFNNGGVMMENMALLKTP